MPSCTRLFWSCATHSAIHLQAGQQRARGGPDACSSATRCAPAAARSVQQRWQEQPADTRERNPGELIRQAIHIERVRLLEAATD